jgi:hypothetical protein
VNGLPHLFAVVCFQHWQGGNRVVPGLIPTARSYAVLLKGGALATAKFILYRCCSMLPCTRGASWVARPSALPTIYHLQKYKERLPTGGTLYAI